MEQFEDAMETAVAEQNDVQLWDRDENFTPMSQAEKVDYLFTVAVKADKLLTELAPQIGPLLEGITKNPMLKMFLR